MTNNGENTTKPLLTPEPDRDPGLVKRVENLERLVEAQYKLLRTMSNKLIDLIKEVARLEK